jgi:hypothetical protein
MNDQNRRGFILHPDLIHTVRKLPPDKAGELFMLILRYTNGEDATPSDLLLEIAFEPIRQQLDRNREKYDEMCKRQSINGKRGGRPKKPLLFEENPENPLLFSETQKSLNKNKNKNKKENKNDNDANIERESTRATFVAPSLAEVVAFAETEGIGSVKAPQDFHDYYTSNGWKVGGRGAMKDWRAAFRRWTRNEKTFENATHKQAPLRGLSARTQSDWDALQEWGSPERLEQARVRLFGSSREPEA